MLFVGMAPIGGPILCAITNAGGAPSSVLIGAIAALAAAAFGMLAARWLEANQATNRFGQGQRKVERTRARRYPRAASEAKIDNRRWLRGGRDCVAGLTKFTRRTQ